MNRFILLSPFISLLLWSLCYNQNVEGAQKKNDPYTNRFLSATLQDEMVHRVLAMPLKPIHDAPHGKAARQLKQTHYNSSNYQDVQNNTPKAPAPMRLVKWPENKKQITVTVNVTPRSETEQDLKIQKEAEDIFERVRIPLEKATQKELLLVQKNLQHNLHDYYSFADITITLNPGWRTHVGRYRLHLALKSEDDYKRYNIFDLFEASSIVTGGFLKNSPNKRLKVSVASVLNNQHEIREVICNGSISNHASPNLHYVRGCLVAALGLSNSSEEDTFEEELQMLETLYNDKLKSGMSRSEIEPIVEDLIKNTFANENVYNKPLLSLNKKLLMTLPETSK